MRKLFLALLILVFTATSAFALTSIITDIDPPQFSLYWTGDDTNPMASANFVGGANPTKEEAWLEALLGKDYNNPSVNYINKFDFEVNYLIYTPVFSWEWAVVKIGGPGGGTHYAYQRIDDNIFNVGVYDYDISHVTFFGGQPIPEPATMLLLGSGLIGLAGFARRRFKK